MEQKNGLNPKEKRTLMIVSLAIVLALVFGISYAYFLAQDESGTQTITTVNLGLTFDDSTPIVNAPNIKPITIEEVLAEETKAVQKTFTLTKKEGSEDIYAKIELANIETTEELAEYDLKWALYQGSEAEISAGTAKKVATGDFGGKTSGNIVLATNQLISSTPITYNLYIWINETNLNQSTMMGQSLTAKIVASGTDEKQNTLASVILGENNANVLPGGFDFENDYECQISTNPYTGEEFINACTKKYTTGLYAQQGNTSKSEMGFPTYYYRGAVTNNYVKFANQTWRIVRINEDGSIRLISQNNIFSSSAWNLQGTPNYVNAGDSESDTIKDVVDDWYDSNIGNDSSLNNKVVTSSFCNDISNNYNAANDRLEVSLSNIPNPIFTCPAGAITVYEKIGLITADEAFYAGLSTMYSSSSYLEDELVFWTITPSSNNSIYVYEMQGTMMSTMDTRNSMYYSARAVINLSPDVIVTGGDGLSANTAYTIE